MRGSNSLSSIIKMLKQNELMDNMPWIVSDIFLI